MTDQPDDLRLAVAGAHELDPTYADLLGDGDEEQLASRAVRVSNMVTQAAALTAENEALRAERDALLRQPAAPTSLPPVSSLQPGASPVNHGATLDYDTSWTRPFTIPEGY